MSRRGIEPKSAVAVVYVLVLFMSVLDVTIINVALPGVAADLGASPSALGAVTAGYLVALAVVIPASGWLADRFGGKAVLLSSVVVFTASSALCGSAQTLPELVAARVLQGVGGGLLTPVGLAMLYRAYPPAERVRITTTTAVVTGLAPVLGPVLGGVLVTGLSWRWVFFVNVPIGLLAVAFGLLYVRAQPVPAAGRLDVVGLVLAGAGLAALLWAGSSSPERGWGDPAVLSMAVLGLAAIGLLVVTQLRTAEPLLRLRLLTQPTFGATTVVLLLGGAAFFGGLYIIALFLQQGLGLPARSAGLAMLPEAVAVLVGAQLAGRVLYPRWGPRRLLVTGLLGVAASLCSMSLVPAAGDGTLPLTQLLLLALLGLSWSLVFLPATAVAFTHISESDTAHASTLFSVIRQVGSATGVAIAASVLAAASSRGDAPMARSGGWSAAFLTAGGVAVLGATAALVVGRSTHDDRRSAG